MAQLSFANVLSAILIFVLTSHIHASCSVPTYKFSTGREMPRLGFGTGFGIANKTIIRYPDEDALEKALGWAIDDGYKMFDTSYYYRTEETLGKVIRQKISKGVVKREDLFIITKLENFHAAEDVVPALRKSLQNLCLDYVDLYLIHLPFEKFPNGTIDPTDYVETWKGMIEVQKEGLALDIGLSNFNQSMIRRIIKKTSVKPAALQIEVNLNLQQPALLRYCAQNDIAVIGYTPFGSLFPKKALPGAPKPRVNDPALVRIAKNHKKTVPQIVLRYLLDLGVSPITMSLNKSNIKENINVFDFSLTVDERGKLKRYDCNYRSGRSWSDSPYYFTRNMTFQPDPNDA